MALGQAGGIDALGGGGGGGPQDAELLLQQIRALLDQYIALGGDTPVAPEAQALADAIDSNVGGGYGDQGQTQPGVDQAGQFPGDQGAAPPPDSEGPSDLMDSLEPQEGEPPRDTSKKSFSAARGSAEKRLKKRNNQ